MELEQPSPVVDAHQLAAQPDLHPLPRRTEGRRHRVQGVLAGHVVIGMDLGGAPVGDLTGLAVPGGQGLAFLITEDLQRLAPGGAVDPLSGDITTPPCRFCPEVAQVPELPALEEALPHVLDAPLHMGFVLGASHPGGIGDEPPVLGVFQEAPGEPGVQRVGIRHRGGEVVDDQVPGDAAEEGPGRLQAHDDVFQLLAEGGPDEAVPGVGQHHDQGPRPAATARLRVLDQTQTAEVQLRHLSGRGLCHPDRAALAPLPVAPPDPPVRGRIRDTAAPGRQQLLDAGHVVGLRFARRNCMCWAAFRALGRHGNHLVAPNITTTVGMIREPGGRGMSMTGWK